MEARAIIIIIILGRLVMMDILTRGVMKSLRNNTTAG